MSSINQFLANFQHGFRSNLFRVNVQNLPGKMQFVCKASNLPGKEIAPVEAYFMNKVVKLRGDVTFPDWTTTIILDNDFSVKNEVEAWMERIQSNADVNGANVSSAYLGVGRVEALASDGNTVLAAYEIFNMFPMSMAQVDLSWDNRDTLTEFEVTWAYSHWQRV